MKSPVDRINEQTEDVICANLYILLNYVCSPFVEKNNFYGCLLVFIHVVLSFSEDRNSVNKLSETIRTNFNERVDEVTKYCYMLYITVTVFIVTNSISVMIYRLVSQNISVI